MADIPQNVKVNIFASSGSEEFVNILKMIHQGESLPLSVKLQGADAVKKEIAQVTASTKTKQANAGSDELIGAVREVKASIESLRGSFEASFKGMEGLAKKAKTAKDATADMGKAGKQAGEEIEDGMEKAEKATKAYIESAQKQAISLGIQIDTLSKKLVKLGVDSAIAEAIVSTPENDRVLLSRAAKETREAAKPVKAAPVPKAAKPGKSPEDIEAARVKAEDIALQKQLNSIAKKVISVSQSTSTSPNDVVHGLSQSQGGRYSQPFVKQILDRVQAIQSSPEGYLAQQKFLARSSDPFVSASDSNIKNVVNSRKAYNADELALSKQQAVQAKNTQLGLISLQERQAKATAAQIKIADEINKPVKKPGATVDTSIRAAQRYLAFGSKQNIPIDELEGLLTARGADPAAISKLRTVSRSQTQQQAEIASEKKILEKFQKTASTQELLAGLFGGTVAQGKRRGIRGEEAGRLADENPGLSGLRDILTKEAKTGKLPGLLNPGNLKDPHVLGQIGFASVFGGLPGAAVSTAAALTPFGKEGALLASTLQQGIGSLLESILAPIKEKEHEFEEAGQFYQRSILGISSVLFNSSQAFGANGKPAGPESIGQQLNAHEREANAIQLAARGRLTKIGIAGATESTFVQGAVSALEARGFSGITPEKIASITGIIGGGIQAQQPQLLEQQTLLLRDLQDYILGTANAGRTKVGQILRPSLQGTQKAKNIDEFITALQPVAGFEQAFQSSTNVTAVQQRLSAAKEQNNVIGGNALLETTGPALAELTKTLSSDEFKDSSKNLGKTLGELAVISIRFESGLAKSTAALVNFVDPFKGIIEAVVPLTVAFAGAAAAARSYTESQYISHGTFGGKTPVTGALIGNLGIAAAAGTALGLSVNALVNQYYDGKIKEFEANDRAGEEFVASLQKSRTKPSASILKARYLHETGLDDELESLTQEQSRTAGSKVNALLRATAAGTFANSGQDAQAAASQKLSEQLEKDFSDKTSGIFSQLGIAGKEAQNRGLASSVTPQQLDLVNTQHLTDLKTLDATETQTAAQNSKVLESRKKAFNERNKDLVEFNKAKAEYQKQPFKDTSERALHPELRAEAHERNRVRNEGSRLDQERQTAKDAYDEAASFDTQSIHKVNGQVDSADYNASLKHDASEKARQAFLQSDKALKDFNKGLLVHPSRGGRSKTSGTKYGPKDFTKENEDRLTKASQEALAAYAAEQHKGLDAGTDVAREKNGETFTRSGTEEISKILALGNAPKESAVSSIFERLSLNQSGVNFSNPDAIKTFSADKAKAINDSIKLLSDTLPVLKQASDKAGASIAKLTEQLGKTSDEKTKAAINKNISTFKLIQESLDQAGKDRPLEIKKLEQERSSAKFALDASALGFGQKGAGFDTSTVGGGLGSQSNNLDKLKSDLVIITEQLRANQEIILRQPGSEDAAAAERAKFDLQSKYIGIKKDISQGESSFANAEIGAAGPEASLHVAQAKLRDELGDEIKKRQELNSSLERSQSALDNFSRHLQESLASREEQTIEAAKAAKANGVPIPAYLENAIANEDLYKQHASAANLQGILRANGDNTPIAGATGNGLISPDAQGDFQRGLQTEQLGLERAVTHAKTELETFADTVTLVITQLKQSIQELDHKVNGSANPGGKPPEPIAFWNPPNNPKASQPIPNKPWIVGPFGDNSEGDFTGPSGSVTTGIAPEGTGNLKSSVPGKREKAKYNGLNSGQWSMDGTRWISKWDKDSQSGSLTNTPWSAHGDSSKKGPSNDPNGDGIIGSQSDTAAQNFGIRGDGFKIEYGSENRAEYTDAFQFKPHQFNINEDSTPRTLRNQSSKEGAKNQSRDISQLNLENKQDQVIAAVGRLESVVRELFAKNPTVTLDPSTIAQLSQATGTAVGASLT